VANRVRGILEKQKGITNLIFDTTGSGYFRVAKGFTPVADELVAALKKDRVTTVKITNLKEVELPKTSAIYELTVAGVA